MNDKEPSVILQEFLDYLTDCKKQYKEAQAVMQKEDSKRQDFVHAIEFENNCKKRSKIATQEHLSRKRRRAAKDKVLKLEKIVKFTESERNKAFINALKGLVKEQKNTEDYLKSDRIYKPRGGATGDNTD